MAPTEAPQARTRQAQSCLACRKIKVKCASQLGGSSKCARCERLDLPCEYVSQRRGRKTNAERVLRKSLPMPSIEEHGGVQPAASSSAIVPGFTHTTQSIHNQMGGVGGPSYPGTIVSGDSFFSSSSNGFFANNTNDLSNLFLSSQTHSSQTQSNQAQRPPLPLLQTPSPTFVSAGHLSVPTSSDQGSHTNAAAAPHHQVNTSAPNLDVSEMLHPPLPPAQTEALLGINQSPRSDRPANDSTSSNQSNPVTLGVVSPLEAGHILSLFHNHLNPVLALLDPQLHTLEFLLAAPPTLLTSVLAVTSKFFRQDLYSRLVEHAQTLVNRYISAGICDLALIQSLMILVCWKEPSDRSAWIKIGMAIRLAYQHGLHTALNRVLPQNEHEARQILDRERAWFCERFGLVCFDRKYSKSFGLPTAIRAHEIGDAETWARGHLHLNIPTDMHLACSMDLTSMYDQFERLPFASNLSSDFWHMFLGDVIADHQRKVAKWFDARNDPPLVTGPSRKFLQFLASNVNLAIRRRAMEWQLGINGGINECLAVIADTANQLEVLAQEGLLNYMHDVTSVVLSEATMLMYKLFWNLSSEQRQVAIALIKRIHATCFRVSEGKGTAAAAFVSRFTQRALISLRAESRAPSPTATGPQQDENENTFLRDLDELLAMNETHPDTTREDEQHWLSLFAPTGDAADSAWFSAQY